MSKTNIVLIVMFILAVCYASGQEHHYGYTLPAVLILALGFLFYFGRYFKDTIQRVMSLSKKNYDEIKFLLENIQEGIIVIDSNGRIFFASSKAAEYLGYEREELTKLKITDIQETESIGAYKKHFEDALEGKRLKYELKAIKKDKTKFDIFVSLSIIDWHGKRAAYCIFTDLTRQKLLERAYKESEGMYKILFESSKDGILISDAKTREFMYANSALCKMLGFTEDEIKKMHSGDIHPRDNLDYIISEFDAYTKGEKSLVENIPCLRKDGQVVYSDINVTTTVINNRKLNIGFFHDITEKKKIESALREAETNFKGLVENAVYGIMMVAGEGKIVYANKRLCDILGFMPEELLKMKLEEIVHSSVYDELYKNYKKRIQGEEAPEYYESAFIKKDGSIIPVDVAAVQSTWHGKIVSAGIVRDITEKKEYEGLIQLGRGLAVSLAAMSGLLEVVNECLETAISIEGLDCGGIYTVDEDTGALEMIIHKGMSDEFVKTAFHYNKDAPSTKLVMAGNAVYINYKELNVPKNKAKLDEKLKAIAIIPIRFEGKVIACMNVSSHTVEEISQNKKVMLETIASQIGGAIYRAGLEGAFRTNEDTIKTALEISNDGILIVNEKGKTIYSNSKFAMMWNIPQEVIKNGDNKEMITYVLEQLKDPQGFLNRVYELYSRKEDDLDKIFFKDGRVFERFSRALFKNGKIAGRIWSFKDITKEN